MTQANLSYERNDHLFRGDDHYANGKYRITVNWLMSGWAGKTVVNVGCGSGDFHPYAMSAGAKGIRAFEPSPWTYQLAKDRALAGCTVEQKGVFELDSNDFRGADIVVMHDVLEHIENDAAVVEKLAALMAPGTEFVISVPALQVLFGRHDEELGHFRRYTLSQLRRLLEPYFEIERQRYYGFFFLPVTWLLSVFLRKPYPKPSGETLLSKFIYFLCTVEERVSFPLGTAVLILARRKPDRVS